MPQWTVEGAFRDSGKETSLLVEAPTSEAASSVALGHGIVVSEVRLFAATAPPPAADAAGALLNYQLPSDRASQQDRRLDLACTVLRFLAYAMAVVAIVNFAMSLPAWGGPPSSLAMVVLARLEGLFTAMLYPAAVYTAAAVFPYVRRTSAGEREKA